MESKLNSEARAVESLQQWQGQLTEEPQSFIDMGAGMFFVSDATWVWPAFLGMPVVDVTDQDRVMTFSGKAWDAGEGPAAAVMVLGLSRFVREEIVQKMERGEVITCEDMATSGPAESWPAIVDVLPIGESLGFGHLQDQEFESRESLLAAIRKVTAKLPAAEVYTMSAQVRDWLEVLVREEDPEFGGSSVRGTVH